MASNRGGLVVGNIPKSAAQGLDVSIQLNPAPLILLQDFMNIGDRIQDFREPLEKAIREVAMPSIEMNFSQEGRPEAWKALSASTLKLRESRGVNSDKILNVSGNLRSQATAFNIWTINQNSAYVADLPGSVWYGVMQQNGLDKIHIPSRPFLILQDSDSDQIEQIFVDWVANIFADNGFDKGSG